MITIIDLSLTTTKAPQTISNWSEVPTQVKDLILNASDMVVDFNELLIYSSDPVRKIIASCTIEYEDYGKIEISDCWIAEGNIWQ